MDLSTRQTYCCASSFYNPPNPTGNLFFHFRGSATRTVYVQRIGVSAINSVAKSLPCLAVKTSTAPSGGTAVALTTVPLDSSNVAATATANVYTAAPTPGTPVGNVRSFVLSETLPTTALTVGAGTGHDTILEFGVRGQQPLVLRGTAEGVSLINGATLTDTSSRSVWVEWTEE